MAAYSGQRNENLSLAQRLYASAMDEVTKSIGSSSLSEVRIPAPMSTMEGSVYAFEGDEEAPPYDATGSGPRDLDAKSADQLTVSPPPARPNRNIAAIPLHSKEKARQTVPPTISLGRNLSLSRNVGGSFDNPMSLYKTGIIPENLHTPSHRVIGARPMSYSGKHAKASVSISQQGQARNRASIMSLPETSRSHISVISESHECNPNPSPRPLEPPHGLPVQVSPTILPVSDHRHFSTSSIHSHRSQALPSGNHLLSIPPNNHSIQTPATPPPLQAQHSHRNRDTGSSANGVDLGVLGTRVLEQVGEGQDNSIPDNFVNGAANFSRPNTAAPNMTSGGFHRQLPDYGERIVSSPSDMANFEPGFDGWDDERNAGANFSQASPPPFTELPGPNDMAQSDLVFNEQIYTQAQSQGGQPSNDGTQVPSHSGLSDFESLVQEAYSLAGNSRGSHDNSSSFPQYLQSALPHLPPPMSSGPSTILSVNEHGQNVLSVGHPSHLNGLQISSTVGSASASQNLATSHNSVPVPNLPYQMPSTAVTWSGPASHSYSQIQHQGIYSPYVNHPASPSPAPSGSYAQHSTWDIDRVGRLAKNALQVASVGVKIVSLLDNNNNNNNTNNSNNGNS